MDPNRSKWFQMARFSVGCGPSLAMPGLCWGALGAAAALLRRCGGLEWRRVARHWHPTVDPKQRVTQGIPRGSLGNPQRGGLPRGCQGARVLNTLRLSGECCRNAASPRISRGGPAPPQRRPSIAATPSQQDPLDPRPPGPITIPEGTWRFPGGFL